MGNLFGKRNKASPIHGATAAKKAAPMVTEQDRAILALKGQRDKIKQYQRRIESQLEQDRQLAQQLLRKDKKDKALLILKKKKFMEKLLEKTDNQLMSLEKLVMDIEFAQIETNVMEGLQVGNEALKQIHSILSIERIEEIMDETREGIEKQKEIDELISGTMTTEDEEDLIKELESLAVKPEKEAPPVAAAAAAKPTKEEEAQEVLTAPEPPQEKIAETELEVQEEEPEVQEETPATKEEEQLPDLPEVPQGEIEEAEEPEPEAVGEDAEKPKSKKKSPAQTKTKVALEAS